MKHQNNYLSKDCLRKRYECASSATQLELEKNRLKLLQRCLTLKRPLQSLRASGLKGLPPEQAKVLLQEVETKATLRTIEIKRRNINTLTKKIQNLRKALPESEDLIKDLKLINIQTKKLDKKIAFLVKCDDDKFKHWKKKKNCTATTINQYNKKVSEKSLKKRLKAKQRKERRLERKINERAEAALENNLVVNSSDVVVPAYSIAILSYGPGCIPCPRFNKDQFQLDGYNAGNKQAWKVLFKEKESTSDIPSKLLKKQITTPCFEINDPAIKTIKEDALNFVENFKPKMLKSNMNKFEREGLDWLKKAVREGIIAITSADKGGAIIIITPDKIKDITADKVNDTSRYKPLDTDPTPELRNKLSSLWKNDFSSGFITAEQSKKVVGLIPKEDGSFTQSTSDITKPGTSYGYPLLKIHKLTTEQLRKKEIPPCRFVTDLSQGVTVRSDKFLVSKWLGPLTKDYCKDLVKDTTAGLKSLDELEKNHHDVDDSWYSISIDIVSLYDSLKHELVIEAIDDAIDTCRQEWSPEFRKWFKDLIGLSFVAAVLKNEDKWFSVENGIPTGGINSVDCANITLFYVLKKLVYNTDVRPKELLNIERFVDDISGQGNSDRGAFENWVKTLRDKMVSLLNLDITYEVKSITHLPNFWISIINLKRGNSQQCI